MLKQNIENEYEQRKNLTENNFATRVWTTLTFTQSKTLPIRQMLQHEKQTNKHM